MNESEELILSLFENGDDDIVFIQTICSMIVYKDDYEFKKISYSEAIENSKKLFQYLLLDEVFICMKMFEKKYINIQVSELTIPINQDLSIDFNSTGDFIFKKNKIGYKPKFIPKEISILI